MKKIKNNKFLIFYFYLLAFTTIFYLVSLHLNLSNAMTEWLINYQGGFTRRGLSGEILFQIADFFNLEFKKTILFVQCTAYCIFFYLTYLLIKELDGYYLIYLSIFSAIFLLFPLSELEGMGRKEVLVSIFLLIFVMRNNCSSTLKIFFLFFWSTFILLIHEIIIFHILYFVLFLFISNKDNKFSYNLKIFLYFIVFMGASWLLFKNIYTIEMKNEMCKSLEETFQVSCGFQTHYVANPIGRYMGEVPFPFWKMEYWLRNSLIFILGYGPLLILSLFSKFNKNNTNLIIQKIPISILLLLLIIPNLFIFYISVDTGRYFHLSYSMVFIFFFGLKFNNLIIFDDEKLNILEKKYFPKNKILCCFVIFLICFTWNPKAVYKEDLGSISIYRIYERIDIYYNTLKW